MRGRGMGREKKQASGGEVSNVVAIWSLRCLFPLCNARGPVAFSPPCWLGFVTLSAVFTLFNPNSNKPCHLHTLPHHSPLSSLGYLCDFRFLLAVSPFDLVVTCHMITYFSTLPSPFFIHPFWFPLSLDLLYFFSFSQTDFSYLFLLVLKMENILVLRCLFTF